MVGIEKLRDIGANKIFEQTHIAKKFVEDILNENFASMNKIQFAGFISILEREYNLDLHELREAYNDKFNKAESKKGEPFVISAQEGEKQSTNKNLYIAGGLIAAGILVALLSFSNAPEEKNTAPKQAVEDTTQANDELDTITIQEAKVNLNHLGNTTVETLKPQEEVTIEPVHLGKFEIIPRSELWIGIVDLETFKRTQKLGSVPFELASDKNWLLVMGHGYVNFEVNGEEQKFKDENKVWFAYENGTLQKLTRNEFKEKNRGKAW
jgi:hypothetical protein